VPKVITKGQANVVTLTLTEKATLTNPYFLFCFENETTQVKTYFTAADTSTKTERYNQFTITEGGDTPLSGVVTLAEGEYNYVVWEQASETNLDPSGVTGEVERGLVKVVGSNPTVTEYENDNNTIITFES